MHSDDCWALARCGYSDDWRKYFFLFFLFNFVSLFYLIVIEYCIRFFRVIQL